MKYPVKKLLFIYITIIMCCSIGFAKENKNIEYWLEIYNELQPMVNIKLTQIEIYAGTTDSSIADLEISTEEFKKVCTKLKFLETAQKLGEKRITQTLYSIAYYAYLNYKSTLSDGKLLFKAIKHSLAIMESFQFALDKILSEINSEQVVLKQITKYLTKIKTLSIRLQQQQAALNKVIKTGLVLESSMDKFIISLEKKISSSFMKDFFITYNIWDPDGILSIPQNLKYWIVTLPNNLDYDFPNTFYEWTKVIILYVITLFFILMIYLLIIKRYHLSLSLFHQLVILLFVIDAWLVAIIIIAPRIIGGFFEIAVIGSLYSLVLLARSLTIRTSKFKKLQQVNASAVFLIFIIGALCILLEIPQSLTFILWFVTLVLFLVSMAVQVRNKQFNLKTKITMRVGIAAVIILLFCILLGYLQLSILLGMTFISICVMFYLGIAATSNIKYAQYRRNKKQPAIRSILIQGFGIPLIWVVLITLVILWLSTRLGFNMFYDTQVFYSSGVTLFGQKVLVRNLSILIFLFFVFKNGLTAIKSYMRMRINTDDPEYISKFANIHFVNLIGWFIFILIVLGFFNIYIRNLIYILGGLSLGIGFGFKPIVENIVGGITLWIDKSIKIGDIVEFEGEFGIVVHIGLRCTRLRTEEQSYVTWPNNMLTNKKLTNWTRHGHLRFSRITVGIGYLADVKKASKIMIDTVKLNPNVMKKPRPFVIFREFGESSLVFDVNFCHYITNELDSSVHESEIRFKLNEKLREEGIEIPYQQLDVNIKHVKKNNPTE